MQLILTITLVSQCQSFCGEDDVPTKVPKVRVANSTHLNVSWHDLFTGCYKQDIAHMEAVVEHTAQQTELDKRINVEFEDKQANLQLNPCLQYKIYLRLYSHEGDQRYKDSKVVKYNDISKLNIENLYGGLLQDEGFMEKICLKEEGVITIPGTSEVSDCILTTGDQENDEFTAPGHFSSGRFIPLQIHHPTNEERLTITAPVYKIEKCDPRATPNTTVPTTTSPSDSILKLGGLQSVIIFTVSILGTILAVALVIAMIYRLKKRKRAAVAPSVDVNPMYGTVYYHLDRAVVTDENDYYSGSIEREGGDEERITDNNPEYSSV